MSERSVSKKASRLLKRADYQVRQRENSEPNKKLTRQRRSAWLAGKERRRVVRRVRSAKICISCEEPAGSWVQFSGLPMGKGICRECAYEALRDMGRREISAVQSRLAFGVPGVNFEPAYVLFNKRGYVMLASFPDHEAGCREANEYMTAFEGTSVLAVRGGRIYIGNINDKGISLAKSKHGDKAV